jgi:hypothetical protein
MADAEEVKPVVKKAAKKPAGNKKPAGKQSEQPPNKKQKAEAKGWMAGPRDGAIAAVRSNTARPAWLQLQNRKRRSKRASA